MPIKQQLNAHNENEALVNIFTDDIDYGALNQLKNMAKLDIIHQHIAVMPDVHAGIGATVGTVIPTLDAIIPAAVGVDIGCGMNALRLSLKASQLPDHLRPIRDAIERAVPVGAAAHKMISARESACRSIQGSVNELFERYPALTKMMKQYQQTWIKQMGTLGSGNHFIELCIDESQDVWVMLHSGSRGLGNIIGRHFIQLAKKDMERHQVQLPDRDLSYFNAGSRVFDDYVFALNLAQEYARINREEMMGLVLRAIAPLLPPFQVTQSAINCHHNYVAREHHYGRDVWLTRKGAISARAGELGIIPGSMGAKSFIVEGKGSAESFCSCSHGAGRRMSRSAARKRFKRDDLMQQTRGVECRKDNGVIDEIPAAYKDIDEVMQHQEDLVSIRHTLKQVLCVKG
ncbi:MAG: RtcB family protein [Gammaproteobacteria bacterium]|nr:RtcB family protein [Gammaproteobacteria bacterium]NVK86731.1 RtcB family protein [Gammaproteobacteria bacterium]